MTDRSFGSQNDQALRYVRRSSVYSRRSFDQPVYMPNKIKPEIPAKAPTPPLRPITSSVTLASHNGSMQDIMLVKPKPQRLAVNSPVSKIVVTPQLQADEEPGNAVNPTWKQRLFTKSSAMVAMAAFVFMFGVGVSLQAFLANKDVSEQVQAMSSGKDTDDSGTSGSDKPDESPLPGNAVANYKVAPELPRKITIPKIKVSARVRALGVSADNQLLAPKSIYDAGWYTSSAKPGVDAGAVLIDGHVHGPTRPGIFVNLKKLVQGDLIEIERGDGKVVQYKVEKTQSLPTDTINMGELLTSVRPGKQGLNLITCGGKYDTKTGHYESRDMVFAVQID